MKLQKGDYYTVEQIAKQRGVSRQAISKHTKIKPHIKKLSEHVRIIRNEDIKGV